eukprot:7647232-Karenia_brevis.AAC.1
MIEQSATWKSTDNPQNWSFNEWEYYDWFPGDCSSWSSAGVWEVLGFDPSFAAPDLEDQAGE